MRRLLLAGPLMLLACALAVATLGCGEDLDEDWATALDTAKDVRGLLVAGGDWTDLALEYSDDPGSKSSGGELGSVFKGQMVPEFEESVFSLQINEISQPVKTTYGYHIIQVTEIAEGRQQTLPEVQNQISATLLETAKQKLWSDWTAQAKSELGLLYRDDLRPATADIPQEGSAALPADAVAKVGDLYVYTTDFTRRLEDTAAQYGLSEEADPATYADMQAWVLENMIQAKLAVQSAPEVGVVVTDDETQAEILSVVQDYFDGDRASFESYLAESGVTMDDFTQQARETLVTQKVYEVLTENVPQTTAEEIAAYYEANKTSYYTEETRVARHILIAPARD